MNRTFETSTRATRAAPRCAALACAVLALGTLSAAGPQLMGPELPAVDWNVPLGQAVPGDLTLIDSSGASVRMDALLDGRPAILALVYYECPMLCNEVLAGLQSALRAIPYDVGTEFDVLVVSIDPGETPAMAAARRALYLERNALAGAPGGWHFLVGEEATVHALASAVGFSYTYVPETDEYAHAAGITLLTGEGVVSSVLFGIEYAPRDLKFALIEASEGKVGSPVDKVLLRCFAYDPAHGKYGLAILSVIRVIGVGTVLLLAAFVLRALRRERLGSMPSAEEAARP